MLSNATGSGAAEGVGATEADAAIMDGVGYTGTDETRVTLEAVAMRACEDVIAMTVGEGDLVAEERGALLGPAGAGDMLPLDTDVGCDARTVDPLLNERLAPAEDTAGDVAGTATAEEAPPTIEEDAAATIGGDEGACATIEEAPTSVEDETVCPIEEPTCAMEETACAMEEEAPAAIGDDTPCTMEDDMACAIEDDITCAIEDGIACIVSDDAACAAEEDTPSCIGELLSCG